MTGHANAFDEIIKVLICVRPPSSPAQRWPIAAMLEHEISVSFSNGESAKPTLREKGRRT
eukprot:9072207-Pyramimonas_sp.AAC.1